MSEGVRVGCSIYAAIPLDDPLRVYETMSDGMALISLWFLFFYLISVSQCAISCLLSPVLSFFFHAYASSSRLSLYILLCLYVLYLVCFASSISSSPRDLYVLDAVFSFAVPIPCFYYMLH